MTNRPMNLSSLSKALVSPRCAVTENRIVCPFPSTFLLTSMTTLMLPSSLITTQVMARMMVIMAAGLMPSRIQWISGAASPYATMEEIPEALKARNKTSTADRTSKAKTKIRAALSPTVMVTRAVVAM